MAVELREQAEQVSAHLSSALPEILGICLFGSVARGDAETGSDIDLLVVGSDQTLTPSTLRRRLPPSFRRDAVAFTYHTPQSLDSYFDRWPRFMAHVREEGRVLYERDGVLRDALARDVPLSTEHEIRAQLRHLQNYDHLERFGGNFLFCLAQLARVGRAVVYALLAERDILEFRRAAAFDRLATELPEARADVEAVRRIQPFYELVARRSERAPPFEPFDCADEVAAAREATRRLIRLSRHADELTDRT